MWRTGEALLIRNIESLFLRWNLLGRHKKLININYK